LQKGLHMSKQERRFIPSGEIRFLDGTTGTRTISGYASVTNKMSEDLGGFKENFSSGAFTEWLATKPDVRHLVDHDPSKICGRTSAGTLRLSEDSEGLHFECDLPDTSVGRDLAVSIARKDISQCSIGFICIKDEWHEDFKTGDIIRTVQKAELVDTSCVSFPAYTGTSVSLRSLFPDDKGHVPTEIQAKIAEVRSLGASVEHSSTPLAEKRYNKVISAMTGMKWAMQPEKLETICALISARANGVVATEEEMRAAMMMSHGDAPAPQSGVAVIPIYGTISHRATMLDSFSGGTSCEAITASLRAALADDTVNTIVFDIDSPGGSVTGVPELGAEIMSSRGRKPMIAVANGMVASAAYWLASCADKIVASPSSDLGSIGVYMMHQDVSGAMEKEGVKLSFVSAGKYKVDGNPYEPLSDEARADLQDGVDKYYALFTQAVAAGRGVTLEKVLADFGQGRMLMAADAVAIGMADEVATLDQVLAGLGAVVTANADQMVGQPTDGMQADVTTVDDTCNCECESCSLGDCKDCTNDACDDPNCDCAEDTDPDTEDDMDFSGQAVVEGTPTALSEEQEWKETFALKLKLAKARISF
jgi:HK97 family phage prohead protease